MAAQPGRDADWDEMTVAQRRDWLRAYVDRVIIHPTRKGMAALDLAAIEVVPGPWAAGVEVPGPAGPLLLPRAISRPPRTCELPGCGRPHQHGGLCGMHRRRELAAEAAARPGQWDRRPGTLRGSKAGPRPDVRAARVRAAAPRRGLCQMHARRRAAAVAAGGLTHGTAHRWAGPSSPAGRAPCPAAVSPWKRAGCARCTGSAGTGRPASATRTSGTARRGRPVRLRRPRWPG